MFTQLRGPTELLFSALSPKNSVQVLETVWDATMELHVPSLKQGLVAVSWKWFCQYIVIELNAAHDCFFAEYDADSLEQEVLKVDGIL